MVKIYTTPVLSV